MNRSLTALLLLIALPACMSSTGTSEQMNALLNRNVETVIADEIRQQNEYAIEREPSFVVVTKQVFHREAASCCPKRSFDGWSFLASFSPNRAPTASERCDPPSAVSAFAHRDQILPPETCEQECLCPGYSTAWSKISYKLFTNQAGQIIRWCRFDEWEKTILCGPDPGDQSDLPPGWPEQVEP